jgi:hypothetical protein
VERRLFVGYLIALDLDDRGQEGFRVSQAGGESDDGNGENEAMRHRQTPFDRHRQRIVDCKPQAELLTGLSQMNAIWGFRFDTSS